MYCGRAVEHGKEALEVFGGEHREFIEFAIECIEKQIPRKPIVKHWMAVDDGTVKTYNCPCCGMDYNRFYIGKPYCMYCGQAILWESDTE